jgi:cytochrome c biogenesis protein
MKKWNQKLWNSFSSMKTGLIMLGLIVLISGIGTFISQNLYDTFGFKLLFGLLCINLIICSISRFNNTLKRTFHPQIPRNMHAVPKKISSLITGKSSDLRNQLEKVLTTHGYRVNCAETTDGWAFVALKHRLGYWGAYIVHIAFVIIIIGVMMGTLGFSGSFMALNGDTVSFKDIYLDKGSTTKSYSVRINSIEDRFLSNGERDNWYTNISIIQGGKELAQGTLSVNHPFTYDGVYYYQSNYADYASIVIENNGNTFQDLVPVGLTSDESTLTTLTTDFQNRFEQKIKDSNLYVKGLKLQNKPIVYLQVSTGEKEPALLKLTQGQSEFVFNQNKITLAALTNATGLKIKADPGVPVVWFGCGLLFFGLILSFYWRPLLVSGVFIQKDPIGTLLMGMFVGKMVGQNEAEFNNIIRNI